MGQAILTLKFHQPKAFRFFWIKYVNGFNPRVHCAKCLEGHYSRHLKYREHGDLSHVVLDEHETPFIYLCGVTAKWEWNVHAAGRFEEGVSMLYSDERVVFHLTNFRQIRILSENNPPAPKEFATCRNWQFGWTAFPETPRQLEFDT